MNVAPVPSANAMTPEDTRLALLVARRYFLEERSKVSIAAELHLSRFKVARLLDQARAEGLVTISITESDSVDYELSARLADELGVRRVLVADPAAPSGALDAVAESAAEHLRRQVSAGDVVGIAWSRAMSALADRFAGVPSCTVVQLCGVLPKADREEHNVELVRRAALACLGTAVTFYAPLVLPDAATTKTLRAQPGIAEALELCNNVSVGVIAVGHWKPGSSTVYDALSDAETQRFVRRGAVAESCGLLFDANGKVLSGGLQKRVVAVTEDQLRRTQDVVALATEPERADAVRAITRSGIVTTLVTHRAVAERLLSK